MAQRELSATQLELFNKYSFNNYVADLHSKTFRLSIDDILVVERNTRQQSNNTLWNMLRLDRQTASGNGSATRMVPQSAAMSYGLCKEKEVKDNEFLMDQIQNVIETTLKCRVSDKVLECGMFLSAMGLYSASPDAYYVVTRVADDDDDDDEKMFIPIEIKCPFTYKDKTINDVRKELGDRNSRYRVKHTALSMNKRGSPLFVVEQTDAHYRQMQRQMYVMNAPMCVYVVKFANSYVVNSVLRDDTFFLKEQQSERKLFEMFVQKNQNRRRFKFAERRMQSIIQNIKNYSTSQAQALAESGLYYDFGTLKCIYCTKQFDVDTPASQILNKHDYCGDTSIKQMSTLYNRHYVSHRKRVESLAARRANISFADQGVYYDGNELKTFCCGVQATQEDKKVKHKNTCKYTLMLTT